MVSLLLVIIYVAFISLGLPDAVLGSAWPTIYLEMDVPVSWMGIVSMIISGGTIISSLFGNKLIHRFSTGAIAAVSTALTALAMFGFSFSHSFWMLCLFAVPYGLGAGSIDVALNNYVSLHYKSRHMSWLHSFWGVGVTIGPYVMGYCLTHSLAWNRGYLILGIIQTGLMACLFISIPFWKDNKSIAAANSNDTRKNVRIIDAVQIPGVKTTLISFFFYCTIEATAGMWASSYMVLHKGIASETAAKWASLFYLGITAGRFLSGFISDKLGDKAMIRIGQIVAILGVIVFMLPFDNKGALIGLIAIGFGCAPVFPCLIHYTPAKFGAVNSQALIGIQMSFAYIGSTFMPLLFGFISDYTGIGLLPIYLLVFALGLLLVSEATNKLVRSKIGSAA